MDESQGLLPLITDRWSPRAFDPERVPGPRELRLLFEAARWAPSCFNEQPWEFVLGVRGTGGQAREGDGEAGGGDGDGANATWQTLLSTLTEKNQRWARTAPVLCLSVARLTFGYNGKPNRWAMHDTGMAVANLYTQGLSMGIYVHQMAGFSRPICVEKLGIPEGYEPVAMMALGHLGDPAGLPEGMSERNTSPRERKPVDDFLHGATWDSRPLVS